MHQVPNNACQSRAWELVEDKTVSASRHVRNGWRVRLFLAPKLKRAEVSESPKTHNMLVHVRLIAQSESALYLPGTLASAILTTHAQDFSNTIYHVGRNHARQIDAAHLDHISALTAPAPYAVSIIIDQQQIKQFSSSI